MIFLTAMLVFVFVSFVAVLVLILADYIGNEKDVKKIAGKKISGIGNTSKVAFSFSRSNILEYIATAGDNLNAYRIAPTIKFRKKKHFCDSLRVGDRSFAVAYVKKGSVLLSVRLGYVELKNAVDKYSGAIMSSKFFRDGTWVDVVVSDVGFKDKQEVFDLLDIGYGFVVSRYYIK